MVHRVKILPEILQDKSRKLFYNSYYISYLTRTQFFKGVVIQRRGSGRTETFTIRKLSNGIGVERIFPVQSPTIEKVEINKKGVVRRARIFYLRDLTGKKARIKERRH